MRRVTGQEQPAVAHRRADEAAHRRDSLLQDRPFLQLPAWQREAPLQLRPDAFVRPRGDLLVRRHLQVEPAQLRAPQAVQREARLVMGIDELVGRRRHAGQDAEPGVRIAGLPDRLQVRRDGRTANAVKPVATGDRIAAHLAPNAVRAGVAQDGLVRGDRVHLGIADPELDRAPGRHAGRDQVLDHLRLRVHRHGPTGEVPEVDVPALPGELQVDPAVLEPLAVKPLREAGVAEHLHAA